MFPQSQLTPEQTNAIALIGAWYNAWKPGDAPFVLQGYAGTGKTSTVSHSALIMGLTQEQVSHAALAGKAAAVMRQKGCLNASTIHRQIYITRVTEKVVLDARGVPVLTASGSPKIERIYETEVNGHICGEDCNTYCGKQSPLQDAHLSVWDECSMVPLDYYHDALGFFTPMLLIGDPGQLPPIGGAKPIFTHINNGRANAILQTIHRQAYGNSILWAATQARNGHRIGLGKHGANVEILPAKDMFYDQDWQYITGQHVVRRFVNDKCRQHYGFLAPYPDQAGAKVVCRKNMHAEGMMNGEIFYTTKPAYDITSSTIRLDLRREGDNEVFVNVLVWRPHFIDNAKAPGKIGEFDWGYCVTAHSAQGSEWDRVCIVDDHMADWNRGQRPKWLYTAITRAAKELKIVDAKGGLK